MYKIFETFVGAGGSHIGFKKEGFESVYVNDFCHEAIETLLLNNPEIKNTAYVDETNILEINPNLILKKINLNPEELEVLFGGIVCKGFSLAGERSPSDERNYFYHKQLEIVKAARPAVSIIENVPGIQTAKVLRKDTPSSIIEQVNILWQELENYKGEKSSKRKQGLINEDFENKGRELRKQKEVLLKKLEIEGYMKSVYQDILDSYEELGYRVYANKLNAACYGAATKRERIIIVAVRKDINVEYKFPEATHGDQYLKNKYSYLYVEGHAYKQVVTVNDALSMINYKDKSDIDNKPMNHSQKTIERFKYIPEGDNIAKHMDNVPKELKISRFYSRGNTMRLNGKDCSPTLVPGHSNFPIHPKEHRSITVREAATITGFPTDYKFIGSHSKRCESVGNAVPPPLAQALAKSVKELLDTYNEKK